MSDGKICLKAALEIDGWMTRRELRWLAEHALNAETIVELGAWKGRSTRALADHCAGQVFVIDPWAGDYFSDNGSLHSIRTDVLHTFLRNLSDHVKTRRVLPMACTSDVGLMSLSLQGVFADLVFIDGDHRESAVRADIAASLERLNPGGILAGHDHGHKHWPAVARVVDELFPHRQLCDSIWWVQTEA